MTQERLVATGLLEDKRKCKETNDKETKTLQNFPLTPESPCLLAFSGGKSVYMRLKHYSRHENQHCMDPREHSVSSKDLNPSFLDITMASQCLSLPPWNRLTSVTLNSIHIKKYRESQAQLWTKKGEEYLASMRGLLGLKSDQLFQARDLNQILDFFSGKMKRNEVSQ